MSDAAVSDTLDYLVIAPHPDDAELGMGGTIALLLAQGYRVGVLDLTDGEPTPHGSPVIRAAETAAATAVLGLTRRDNLGLPNRSLVADLDARAKLASYLRLTRPPVIFAPFWEDAHPDHVAATRLIEDARFWAKLTKTDMAGDPFHPRRIVHYFCIHLRIHPQPSFVVDVSDHIETKMRSVQAYTSQLVTGRDQTFPTVIDDVRDRARYWGWAIGAAYGEPFVCREPLGVRRPAEVV